MVLWGFCLCGSGYFSFVFAFCILKREKKKKAHKVEWLGEKLKEEAEKHD